MEEQQQIQPNKYRVFFEKYRYNVYFIGAIVVLFIMIIGMIALIANTSTKKASSTSQIKPSQTSSNTTAPKNPTSVPTLPVMTPNPTQAAVIESQTQPQITPYVAVPYTVTNITQFGDNWATMNITNPDVGGGVVILQKVNGAWKRVMGPGSYFPIDQLQQIGAPQQLINSFTPSVSPVSPVPTSVPGDLQ